MKKLLIALATFALLMFTGESYPYGPRGGGGGGFRGGGGGGGYARPATPSFSGGGRANFGGGQVPSGARPGMVPQNRPNIGGGGFDGNRPNIGGGGFSGGIANRPNIGGDNRPNFDIGNRPNIDMGNRPQIGGGIGNQTNIGNRTAISNRTTNINQNNININRQNNVNVNRRGSWNQPWNHYHWNNWNYGHWNNWYRPAAWFGAGAVTGASLGWLAAPGETYVYSNPYYVAPTTVVVAPALDYSQPIQVPAVESPVEQTPAIVYDPGTTAAPATPAPASNVPPEAEKDFSAARDAFKQGDYAQAQALVEKAIAVLPGDPTLHEFRGLALFAQKKYQDAAAAVYAVLSVGPGWDWATVRSLYGDPNNYTVQLRALEQFQRQNPKDAATHFLLAYHYLVLASPKEAAGQLEQVVKLEPNDKLSQQLLKALQQSSSGEPAAQP